MSLEEGIEYTEELEINEFNSFLKYLDNLKSPKQYDLKPTGTNTFTINIDKKFYNKFLELAMNNKIDIRG